MSENEWQSANLWKKSGKSHRDWLSRHAELIFIHPFREGNGRCARVLATLMALQTDLPPLNFSGVHGKEKRRYVAAIHQAMERNYEPMKEVFRRVIARSLRVYRGK